MLYRLMNVINKILVSSTALYILYIKIYLIIFMYLSIIIKIESKSLLFLQQANKLIIKFMLFFIFLRF